MIDTPTNGRATEIGRPAAPLDDVRKPPRDPDDPFKQQLETIMYVPGLFCSENEFETIVAKLADALTTFGADLSSRYRYAKAAVQLKPGGSASAAGFTISKDSPAGPVPLFDVFKLDYEACVVGEYVRAHVLIKALQLILTLRWLAPAIWRTARLGYRKTQSQRNQLIYALGILLGVAFYFGLTFVAIAEIVFTTLTPNKAGGFDFSAATTAFVGWFSKSFPSVTFLVGGPCAVAPLWTGHHYASFVATAASVTGFAMLWSRSALETAYHYAIALPGGLLIAKAPVITLVLTALGLASPRLRSNFENIMNHMLVAIEYFRIGFARNKTTGQFYDLYDDLCKAQDRYARVHVMGYSLGSLVALDALFYTRGATQQRIDRLGDLITIGAPITMAQKFWPKHSTSSAAASRRARLTNGSTCSALSTSSPRRFSTASPARSWSQTRARGRRPRAGHPTGKPAGAGKSAGRRRPLPPISATRTILTSAARSISTTRAGIRSISIGPNFFPWLRCELTRCIGPRKTSPTITPSTASRPNSCAH